MNTGYTDVETDPFSGLAPITRIGGGEVRVDRALRRSAAAWDADTLQGGLSFGFVDVDKDVVTLHKTVSVRNYSNEARDIHGARRRSAIPQDAAWPGVGRRPDRMVRYGPASDHGVPVKMTINGADLPANAMSSGPEGRQPGVADVQRVRRLPVPRRRQAPDPPALARAAPQVGRADGPAVQTFKRGDDLVSLNNLGVGNAQTAAYSMLAPSPNLPEGGRGGQSPTPDMRAFGVATIPVPAGFCSASPSFLWQFAVNTWERQSHLLPVSHMVFLDTNQNGMTITRS